MGKGLWGGEAPRKPPLMPGKPPPLGWRCRAPEGAGIVSRPLVLVRPSGLSSRMPSGSIACGMGASSAGDQGNRAGNQQGNTGCAGDGLASLPRSLQGSICSAYSQGNRLGCKENACYCEN